MVSLLLLLNNIKKYQFLIAAIYLSLSLAQVYSISGTVLDSETDQLLSNVNIYIKNSDIGTVTDNQGYFKLSLNNQAKNNINLNIKMIGYKEKIIQLDLSKTEINLGKLFLKPQFLELDAIHIHSHENESKQISDISLSGQKLNDNLTGNIATTLSNQTNIGINSFGTVTSKPVLRGYLGDRFLLTKDKNEIGDLSNSSIDHVITLDMTEVSEIEIVRGPKVLIYGSNAVGGVINTSSSINPKAKVNKILTKILFGGETFNKGLYGSMMLYAPIKSSQINILLSNRNTKNQSSPDGELINTYSETDNYKLGFTKYNKNSYINFVIEKFNMNYGIPPFSQGHIAGVDIELIKNTFQINYHQDISFLKFNQFDFNYNFIDYEHQEFENNLTYSQVSLSKNTHNFKIEFQSSNSIIGSELNYKQFFPGGLYFTPKTDELDLSLYFFNDKKYNWFDLLSSFRVGSLLIKPDQDNLDFLNIDNEEVQNREFSYLSSSLGIKKIINKFEINMWIMNAMRGPKIEELYSDGPHLGSYSYEIGEPNLELEKTYGFESSVGYKNSPINISLTTFYNYSPYYYQMSKIGECGDLSLTDCLSAGFIQQGVGPGGFLYKYKTKGVESLIRGLEFNLSYNYQRFKATYDFSLVRGDNLTNGLPLSYINPDKQILVLEYQKELKNYKLRLSKIHSQNRLGEFESYTPSSFLVDLVIGYTREKQNITIQLNNIFNKKYYNHLSKIKTISPEAGRNIIINYKIFF